ncbi:MAG TPA: right-handed parallel beta-helix repeat-containing protein, partial [Phycisphaerales bacterium]|nr:right-handed parallel beta-helix repeat-containing protein [Phycisphaerales bacterium]
MSRVPVVCTIIASTAILLASAILTAGPLDPPAGPIAPTYKTLGEIEPRTAINAANTPGNSSAVYVISQPGSYYLTGDVVNTTTRHSILISADHVTIDLNGFAIRGNFSNISGIAVSGSRTNLAIRNGTIQGHGSHGINLLNASVVLISDIRATGNALAGVTPGKKAVLTNVVCSGGAFGFFLESAQECILTNCIASETTSGGFVEGSGRISFFDCIASNTGGSGFVLPAQSQARGCTSTNNSGYGFDVTGSRATMQDCIAESNLLGGYNVQFPGARMTRCSAGQNGNGTTKYSGF